MSVFKSLQKGEKVFKSVKKLRQLISIGIRSFVWTVNLWTIFMNEIFDNLVFCTTFWLTLTFHEILWKKVPRSYAYTLRREILRCKYIVSNKNQSFRGTIHSLKKIYSNKIPAEIHNLCSQFCLKNLVICSALRVFIWLSVEL